MALKDYNNNVRWFKINLSITYNICGVSVFRSVRKSNETHSLLEKFHLLESSHYAF